MGMVLQRCPGITGAGRGIGKAIALAFAREKSHVVINGICPRDELERVAGCPTYCINDLLQAEK